MKYLYATHIYDWGMGKLSYYISLMGGLKALFLLILLPCELTNMYFRVVLTANQLSLLHLNPNNPSRVSQVPDRFKASKERTL